MTRAIKPYSANMLTFFLALSSSMAACGPSSTQTAQAPAKPAFGASSVRIEPITPEDGRDNAGRDNAGRDNAGAPVAPVAAIHAHPITVHGDTRVDNYYWLRQKDTPEVLDYLKAENAYTDAIMKPTLALQETLYRESLGRIQENDVSVPTRDGQYFYYMRTEKGKQYPIYLRKRGSLEASEEVLLDLNELAKAHPFVGLGAMSVSDDGRYLAYTIDTTGFRDFTLHVKDLTSGKVLPDTAAKASSLAWSADGRYLFYTLDDHAKRSYRAYRHRLGEDTGKDALLYEESDERLEVILSRSRSKRFIMLSADSLTTSEVRYLDAKRPEGTFSLIALREQDHQYEVTDRGDRFYIRTNDKGRNFRVVTAPIKNPERKRWTEMIPHREDTMIEGFEAFADFYVVRERQGGLPHLGVSRWNSKSSQRIPMPEPVYSLFPEENPEFQTSEYRYRYQSLTTPASVMSYDVKAGKSTLLKRTEVLGGYEPSHYQAERIFATAEDGAKIPISLVYKQGQGRGGSRPLLLVGYGSYGSSYPAMFSFIRPSLLDRGVTVAIAHIRGGGDMGKKWHDSGRMLQKRNTFTDFISAAEHLIAEGYADKSRLAIQGGSAGGLLVSAVTNMRPDLFRAVVAEVPFVDVVTTMLDDDLPLTVAEFEEWGNPQVKEQYEYMKSYCPYTNIKAQDYPAILVTTSYNDSQVMYWEPAKYVAKLRAHKKADQDPLLFRINMAGGHGGSSGRYDNLREEAFNNAFILTQLGIRE